jgi:membrane protease YdiL (CAAX protease family)
MNENLPSPPSFWRTVRLLLGAARKRAKGRRKRQQQLLNQRAGRPSTRNWSGLGFAFAILLGAILNLAAAYLVTVAFDAGKRLEVEHQGKIVVSHSFLSAVREAEAASEGDSPIINNGNLAYRFFHEAERTAEKYGGSAKAIEQKLREAVSEHGREDLVTDDEASPGITAVGEARPIPAMLGSLVLLWWLVMLVSQGEGMELDLQRRRHPMWEWLFAHPVPPGAVFLAEMLSPMAANPIYWGAPLFVGLLYGFVYGAQMGAWATLLAGVPITVAAACLGKALEIGIILRFSARTRGAMIGLMGWMGYASTMLFFLGIFIVPRVVEALGKFLYLFAFVPWPWLRLFLGGRADGSFSFWAGMATCWIFAGVAVAGAVRFSLWGAEQGLSGSVAAVDTAPSRPKGGAARFGKEPLYRKEFLWFVRDRSAIVQTILIPLTVAGVQLFNFRHFLTYAQGAWNYLCGAGILFGTYFLWVLGPKSLTSEGPALWIALTWPRGLESLLKAKAWLWSMISTGIVALVLCYAVFLFPGNAWQIALVGIGWFFFGRSMAEKAVTLVTVTSASGEPEKIPWGRRWATQLGMVTFAVGVLTRQWNLAVVGIVYSYITAAAMWQNFRARLPYLYDPWSERLPPPPTLMHAMVAISILVEAAAVFTGVVAGIAGRENVAMAQAISYGFCSVMVSLGMSKFLSDRHVPPGDVWRWPAAEEKSERWWRGDWLRKTSFPLMLLAGAGGGVSLGLFARGYLTILQHLPATAELLRRSQEQMAQIPNLKISMAVMAVVFAPFAEEYLFRGLVFRALDGEWGGWRAVLGSAGFFAIYHPPLSWLPVALLGAANALLFKKTGRLAPAVVLHMVYNAAVLS